MEYRFTENNFVLRGDFGSSLQKADGKMFVFQNGMQPMFFSAGKNYAENHPQALLSLFRRAKKY